MSNQALAVLISLTAFAVVHSLTAAPASKRLVRDLFGERLYHGLYRLLYNICSASTVMPVLYVMATQHHSIAQVRPIAYGTALVVLLIILLMNMSVALVRYRMRRVKRE